MAVVFSIIASPRRERILLVKLSYGGKKWSLPGGYINRGESTKKAAYRELEEETGINKKHRRWVQPLESVYKGSNVFIFRGKFDFLKSNRLAIFKKRTTPKEITDYGFYNPKTGLIESYNGIIKSSQLLRKGTLSTIKK